MCSTDVSFLSTDVFYSNALHVLTTIEIPLHIFGALVVLTRTPQRMSSVKRNMMVLHCAGAISDVYLSLVSIPVLTVPMCAGYPLGISASLEIPTDVQVYLGFTLVPVVVVAILGFFEDRHHVLCNGVTPNRSRRRRAYLTSMYLLACLYMIPGYLAIPNQSEGRAEVLRHIPCFPSELLDRPGFFVLAVDSTVLLLCFATISFILSSQLLYFIVRIVHRLSSTTSSKSKNLLRLQKQFLVSLGIQVAVPTTVLFVPAVYFIVAVFNDFYNQALTNVVLILISFHGLASTVTMLSVHKPYRDATLDVFCLSRTAKKKEISNGSNRKIWAVSYI